MTASKRSGGNGGRALNRISSELHAHEEDSRGHRLRRYVEFELHVKPPWDVPLAFAIVGALLGCAILGSLVIIWSRASVIGVISGVILIAVAAGMSSHFAHRLGATTNEPTAALYSR